MSTATFPVGITYAHTVQDAPCVKQKLAAGVLPPGAQVGAASGGGLTTRGARTSRMRSSV